MSTNRLYEHSEAFGSVCGAIVFLTVIILHFQQSYDIRMIQIYGNSLPQLIYSFSITGIEVFHIKRSYCQLTIIA
ncbi:hypothetical protein D1872_229420 [compost metagenome]